MSTFSEAQEHREYLERTAREVWTPCECTFCGDEAVTLPGTTCGRDFAEELEQPDGTVGPFCHGIYVPSIHMI